MSRIPDPGAYRRQLTFREYLDELSRPRGVADNGAERYNPAVSRPLRLFVRAQPRDHNLSDLLAIVPDDLRAELTRVGRLYDAAMTPFSALVARTIAQRLDADPRRERSDD